MPAPEMAAASAAVRPERGLPARRGLGKLDGALTVPMVLGQVAGQLGHVGQQRLCPALRSGAPPPGSPMTSQRPDRRGWLGQS
jgi:hypothetical protein